ncbi:MAG: BON domain-containing protein [Planctomycetota bacterium]
MLKHIALILGALAVPLAAAHADPTDTKLTDPKITRALERELLSDRAVPFDDIDVDTSLGIVTMTGSVDNLLAKERAVRVAETVKGVRAVIDRITIDPITDRSDAEIERDVHRALLDDPATDSYEVDVAVAQGAVTLSGTVDSWHERDLPERVAMGVRGVRSIQNDIHVVRETMRVDSEISAEIKKALRWNALVDDALIDVSVTEGKVRLDGTVGSAAERRLAISEAWTSGVSAVDATALKVKGWARDPDLRGDKFVLKEPAKVEDALDMALVQDPRVYSFNVEADADPAGVVTLRGTVDNLKALRAAEDVALHTVGVHSVLNHLRVRPAERSDTEIATSLRDAIQRDPYLDGYEVAVRVHDGVAHLSGTVDTFFEKGHADDVAARINGVKRVANKLEVEDLPYAYSPYVDDWVIWTNDWYVLDHTPRASLESDSEIRDAIVGELWWSPYVSSDQVTVEVSDGVATLSGTVDSWWERYAARQNAVDGGAIFVRNELEVADGTRKNTVDSQQ